MKMCLLAYADSQGRDQPAHAHSLIRTFTLRLESLGNVEHKVDPD